MPCGSQNKLRVLSHTLSKSPDKWSMDQLCNSNTRNKAHTGISNVYRHYPNSSPIQMKWIPGTCSCLAVFECGRTALKRPSQKRPQTWPWWMAFVQVSADADGSASQANDRSRSQCDGDEGRRMWNETERCTTEHSSHSSSHLEMWAF